MPQITWKNSKVKRIHDTSEVKKLLASDGPCMVIIYADWCGHCQAAEPEWTKLANLVDGKADVYAIESDEYKGDDVNGYPTVKIVKKGVSSDYSGGRTASEMKSALLGTFGGRKRSRRTRTRRLRGRARKTHRTLG